MCERRTDAAVEAKVGPDGLGLLVVSCNDDADNDGLTDGGATNNMESLCKAASAKVSMLNVFIFIYLTFLKQGETPCAKICCEVVCSM
mmetsp:Transcript_41099/g.70331  ORF Transcript_41099/g.70331 Transcript_41099/m.70331 type:complete len:88 (-) Transcript_41099:42-305(-)